MKSKIDEIASIGKNITDKKSVYFEISPAPSLFTFGQGTFLNEMIEIIGAKNIFADEKGWISPSAESVIDKNPDIIFTNVDYTENPFLNEMIEIIGAKNIFADEKGWISPSAESVIDKNPDIIFTNVDYTENPIKEIETRDGFENISAVKNNAVYQIDKNSSSRPSQNIILALSQMAESIYPDKYEK